MNQGTTPPPPLLRKPSPLETYFKVGLVFVKVLGMALFNEGREGLKWGKNQIHRIIET